MEENKKKETEKNKIKITRYKKKTNIMKKTNTTSRTKIITTRETIDSNKMDNK